MAFDQNIKYLTPHVDIIACEPTLTNCKTLFAHIKPIHHYEKVRTPTLIMNPHKC